MTAKTTLVACTTLLVALGLLPGVAGTVQTNDAITRQFDAFVFWEIEFKDPGFGVHSPTSPCPIIIFGIRALVADVIYYQSDREATNYKLGSVELPTGQPDTIVINGPCPIPGSGPGAPVILTIPNINVYGPYDAVSVDQILCPQGNGPLPVTCLPQADTGLVVVSHCNKEDVSFTAVADNKGALGNGVGSRSINCLDSPLDPTDGFKYSVTYYDGAPTEEIPGGGSYVDDWFFTPGLWGTDFSLIQNEDTTPLGNGIDETGYQVACTAITVLVIDPNKTPSQYEMRLESHDYKLILDLDAKPLNWVEAKLIHHANNLQGWHDLGGKNGFPCPRDNPGQPVKKGDFPIIPTPLSPKKGGEPNICIIGFGGPPIAQCAWATCGPAVGFPIGTIDCVAEDACEPKLVAVAALLGSFAEVHCDHNDNGMLGEPGELKASTLGLPPPLVGMKDFEDYHCVVFGSGICFDP